MHALTVFAQIRVITKIKRKPKMGGRVLAENIANLYPEIKILFVSGYTDNAIVHHRMLDPDVAFLAKPFTPVTLVNKVREVLDTSELSKKN